MSRVIPPTPDQDDQYFWDGVAARQLLLQRCARCHTLRHPPAPMCGRCHALEWDTQESPGRGAIHSWIVSRHPTDLDAEPRVVVLVERDEGVRLVGNLVDVDLDEVRNEMQVEVCFLEVDGVLLPQFRPAVSVSSR
jgi:uncharacterized OB-fold protein